MEQILITLIDDYFVLTGCLIGMSIFLRKWQPPIGEGIQFIILQIFAMLAVIFFDGVDVEPYAFGYAFMLTAFIFYGEEFLTYYKNIKAYHKDKKQIIKQTEVIEYDN